MPVTQHCSDFFQIHVQPGKMEAALVIQQSYALEEPLSVEQLKEFLNENHIVHGTLEDVLLQIASMEFLEEGTIVVAKGTPPVHGKDGFIKYEQKYSRKLDLDDRRNINFREVMTIPTVVEGEKIATIFSPTLGESGMNVLGEAVPAVPGKKVLIKPGKNTEWKEEEQAIYSMIDGQLSVEPRAVHVYPQYEVNGDITMKIGNLNFVGTIVIRGNVPTGYQIIADGDIKIYGLVEGATLIAGGSIFISEGIVGSNKSRIKAGTDVRVGYINQGHVVSNRNIFVENSILHSQCVAKEHIYCQRGNIIGGSLSAGVSIHAKDIGNRMSTKTELFLGMNKESIEKVKKLNEEKEEVVNSIKKLELIGEKLKLKEEKISSLTPKEKVVLLRQRNSLTQSVERLAQVDEELLLLKHDLKLMEEAHVIVTGVMYLNVDISFGKYRKIINHVYQHVKIKLENKEVAITSL
ncbi:FapA family protein [Bacillaceae bacterium S4-13-56]